MKFLKKIVLKDNKICILRNPEKEEAETVLEHLIQTSGESDFLARYPDEIHTTVEQEQQFLDKMESDPYSAMIVAIVDGQVVGTAGISPVNTMERFRHRAELGISVKSAYSGLGIGTGLLTACMEAATQMGFQYLELEVMTENDAAIRLYDKFGFEIYGKREDSFRFRDGSCRDAYLMRQKI